MPPLVLVAPFALSGQGSVDQFAASAFLVVEPSDAVEPFSIVAIGLVHVARADLQPNFRPIVHSLVAMAGEPATVRQAWVKESLCNQMGG